MRCCWVRCQVQYWSKSPLLISARRLVYCGFIAATGWWRPPDVLSYLRAIEQRVEKLPATPHRDRSG